MSDAQKKPLTRTLPQFARQTALAEIKKRGRSLPGKIVSVSGQIVTVSFSVQSSTAVPQCTMPLAYPPYIRLPIQAGDIGAAIAVDASLALLCGIGTDPATMDYLQGNLATLLWLPLASASLSAVDPNALTLYGPNGVVMRDSNSETVSTLTPSGLNVTAQTSITFQVGTHSIVINASGITIDGVPFLPHTHSDVESGSSNSGPVVT